MSAWVFLLLGGMDSIVFGPIRWCVWSFRPSSPLRLPHLKFLFVCFCRVRSWMSAWVFLLLGGMDSIVFGPIRWCVWSFRPSSPLRLPHLKFFVCLFVFPEVGPTGPCGFSVLRQQPLVLGLVLLNLAVSVRVGLVCVCALVLIVELSGPVWVVLGFVWWTHRLSWSLP